MAWTLKQVAQWCGGAVRQEFEDTAVTGFVYDSREVTPGVLFAALPGAQTDGHSYVEQAVDAGAAAVMVMKPQRDDLPQIVVEDTETAMGEVAAAYRRHVDPKVVGITGSVGKTTTKEMTAAVLETSFRTAKSRGNLNSNIGLPFAVMEMPEDTEIAVLEMGMNHFGEMARLSAIARPNISVVTNIGTAHIEYLGSRDGILQAKMEILQGMTKNDCLVLCGDEPLLWNLREQDDKHKKYYFGVENPQCDVVAQDVRQMDGGMSFRVVGMGHQFEIFIPVEGIHAVYDAMAALTVGILCGVKAERMQLALSHFRNTGMRQEITEHAGMTIIADCYNAGPESMEAELNVLGDYKTDGRRIAVLGDMLELGNRSWAEHYRIGRIAAKKADLIFAYGT
ncbi:MAG: UDP-N-acetylmuramoyl-tripeptide--D-alanyl-D-alanine ligase [Oscillospiraceae bacterium]|nr:UDP-N-acetylmuramoyl-tripeptide--D-alanyl-D-alanine ligase [Oscillospiraceae bacterium]